MKRIIIVSLLLLFAVTAQAQQPSAEQQKAFSDAVAVAERAGKELSIAQARVEAAQAKAQAMLYQIMALLKLSPAEFKAVLKEGELSFEKIVRSPSENQAPK